MLTDFNFDSSFKLQWCYARDSLYGFQLVVTIEGFEL